MSSALSARFEGAIARPDVPQHFMVLRPVGRKVVIRHGDTIIARSDDAVWLMEVGKTLYSPVIYLPKDDLEAELVREEKSTRCPLKGEAIHFRLPENEEDGEIAWSYEQPLDFSKAIEGLIAFYGDNVTIEIGG